MSISVIIPFHKGISLLDDCLQSLVQQSYKGFEVILVCDHTMEDVASRMDIYGDKLQIVLLELLDKTGVAAARNLGLSVATGKYVYFLDSDDYIVPTTMELLAQAVMTNTCDLVYGSTVSTWYSRCIFMKNYDPKDMTVGKEDIDGDNKQLAAYEQLISQQNGVQNISVLNLLILRSILEDNNIRFNEKLNFLSDYPFLLETLMAVKEYEYQPGAVYIKRNHNNSDNLPLSRMKESNNFTEFVGAYNYVTGFLHNNRDLKNRIDRKVIEYSVDFFAPKLILNDNVNRNNKFETIHQIINGMEKDLLNHQNKYIRKLLHAFYLGDMSLAKKIIKKQLRMKKLKAATKNKNAFYKHLYMKYFIKLPLKQNFILFESFMGRNYSDSPKYIYEYLSKHYPKHYKFIWVIDKKNIDIPYKQTKVKRLGLRYVYYLARSKYYVFNGRQPEWTVKREGNIFLQTWHGTPLKKLVFDREDINSEMPKYKQQVYKQSRQWDYLIAANQFSSDIFRSCFRYDNIMLETGYPRNDLLYSSNKEQIGAELRNKLKIPQQKKVILYAPTFRDDELHSKWNYKFSLHLNLKQMKEKIDSDYVILLRTHYFIADVIDLDGVEDFVYNVSDYDDIAELYLISDILITDYSSVFFDYANLKRPMLFFTYDLEKYRDELHGFYIDIEKELPGPLLFTTEEVISAIIDSTWLKQEYQQKYKIFYNKYCSWENGQSSRKVVEKVFDLIKN